MMDHYNILVWVFKGFRGIPSSLTGGTYDLKDKSQAIHAQYGGSPPQEVIEDFLRQAINQPLAYAVRVLCLEVLDYPGNFHSMKTGDQITFKGRHGRFIRDLPDGMAEIAMGSQQVSKSDLKLYEPTSPEAPPPKPALHPLVGKTFQLGDKKVRCAHVTGELATVMLGTDSWDVPVSKLGDPISVKPPSVPDTKPSRKRKTTSLSE